MQSSQTFWERTQNLSMKAQKLLHANVLGEKAKYHLGKCKIVARERKVSWGNVFVLQVNAMFLLTKKNAKHFGNTFKVSWENPKFCKQPRSYPG